jgi:cbb3-type cytochrome oxidase maturation protein
MPLALAGIAIVLAGVIGAAVLWSVAEGRHDDTIADFARAPAGCDTTLTFEREGRFVIYVETAGHVDAIDGDCDVAGAFVRSDEVNPAFEVVVVDADGERIAIDGHSGVAYDSDGYVGASIGSLEIDGPGNYVVRVASSADDFVVAVGIDPDDDAAVLRLAAISVLIGGLVVGGTALVLAARQRREPASVSAVWSSGSPAGATGTWQETTGAPTAPPPTAGPPVAGEAPHPPSQPARPVAQPPWAPPAHRDR